ncbi:MAG: 2-amino-4-hydroxy-6-hydroxymethyldihydropteridine diphosphokinase [Campylobacterales bacterium]|nr:2-amino-4-hydroxy-6-hydroxymethyldihydropteridine diphosphokinase [Campylobacterales bacterium]
MRKKLDDKNTLIKNSFFPRKYKESKKSYRVLLGIGGNVGNTISLFKKLSKYLEKDLDLDLIKTSPILINPPFGFLYQDDFKNALLVVKTNLNPEKLLKKVNYIEKKFGRKRSFKDAPRTLDIDIIFFENKKVYNDKLIIPHIAWSERSSVLVPLCYL